MHSTKAALAAWWHPYKLVVLLPSISLISSPCRRRRRRLPRILSVEFLFFLNSTLRMWGKSFRPHHILSVELEKTRTLHLGCGEQNRQRREQRRRPEHHHQGTTTPPPPPGYHRWCTPACYHYHYYYPGGDAFSGGGTLEPSTGKPKGETISL